MVAWRIGMAQVEAGNRLPGAAGFGRHEVDALAHARFVGRRPGTSPWGETIAFSCR